MSNTLAIIKAALANRESVVGVVVAVNGLSVKLATSKGAVEATSTVMLSVGDNVTLANGIATKVKKASVVEPV